MSREDTSTRYGREILGADPSLPVRLPPLPPLPDETIFIRRRAATGENPDQFQPISMVKDGASYTVLCQPGFVEEVVPKSGVDCVALHEVSYNGAVHTDETEIAIPVGSTLACRVKQDKTGAVLTGEDPEDPEAWQGPSLVVEAEVPESSHWYPDDPVGDGAGGTMYFPLFTVEETGGVTEVIHYHWGPVAVRNDLWIGVNVGGGSRVFKEHVEGEGALYRFRNIEGAYGITDTEGDDILIEFDAENIGFGQQIYQDDTGLSDTAQFRTITDGPSGQDEITVDTSGDHVRVYGNGVDRTITFDDCYGVTNTLEFIDGLLASTTSADFTHYGSCDYGGVP